jgi:cytochrome c oxidase subunit 3
MTNSINSTEEPKPILSVNVWKFITWLFIVTIIMFFAAFTSAYIVRRAEGNWVEFPLPNYFWYSTAVLILSSLLMHLSVSAAKKDEFGRLKLFISLTLVFGIVFLILQYLGWIELQASGVYLKGNPSGSFLYILTGLHMFHLITGLGVLIFGFVAAYRMSIHSQNLNQIQVCATYWHFLDILWVYLFVFLLYFR